VWFQLKLRVWFQLKLHTKHKMDPLFDWKVYLANYEDLRDSGICTEQEALQHWNDYGKREGRIRYGVKMFTNGYSTTAICSDSTTCMW